MIRVRTRTPEFISDIGDMLRLFLGDVQIVEAAPGEEADYEHEIIERDGVLENTRRVGAFVAGLLREMQKKYPCIGDVRQVGLHVGIEFVKDPATKEPDLRLAQTVKQLALRSGAIFGEAGYRMNVLKFKPPLVITEDEAGEAMAILESAVGRALAM